MHNPIPARRPIVSGKLILISSIEARPATTINLGSIERRLAKPGGSPAGRLGGKLDKIGSPKGAFLESTGHGNPLHGTAPRKVPGWADLTSNYAAQYAIPERPRVVKTANPLRQDRAGTCGSDSETGPPNASA